MSTILVLKKDDMVIKLNRSYHYKVCNRLPQSHEEIDDACNQVLADAKNNFTALAAYRPQGIKDLISIPSLVQDYSDDLSEALMRYGRASVIVELMEEGFIVEEVS